ncbi:DUF5802 family protein [Halorussus salilacus]|uniref:DUF5802 family protein n=1 Tax=Halorussus salilacus TaxID=2953750 RepID=UPI0020A2203A|nr:DUF5802 family protein [Halorussus salilacus]USZ67274.1 DUF5802 family protein [Halorussus salilacus]
MFEEFSSGYYLGRLYVEPYHGDEAVIRRDQHEQINEQLYATGEGIERLDNPLVMKVDSHHLAVHGEDEVPEGTLALPEEVLDDTRIRNPPALKEVLLAKADRADQLLRYQARHPGVGT